MPSAEIRKCGYCDKPLPPDSNVRKKYCNKICAQRKRTGAAPKIEKVRKDGKVWCAAHEEYLPKRKFKRLKSGRFQARCKECTSAYHHEHRLKREYGIDSAQYAQLMEHQGGVCAICQMPSRIRRLAVDHNHETGEVRGLLCRRCNRDILGAFARDQIAVLQRAIDYLTEPPARSIHLTERNMDTDLDAED